MFQGNVKLMGAAIHSRSGHCKDCNRAIINTSRTRPKARCEICSKSHYVDIHKQSAVRSTMLAKARRLAKSKNRD